MRGQHIVGEFTMSNIMGTPLTLPEGWKPFAVVRSGGYGRYQVFARKWEQIEEPPSYLDRVTESFLEHDRDWPADPYEELIQRGEE